MYVRTDAFSVQNKDRSSRVSIVDLRIPVMPRKPRPAADVIKLYVTSSGPAKGEPDCKAAFQTKDDAVRFLTDLHGLEIEESKRLRKELQLPLKRRVHGSDCCYIQVEAMPPTVAEQALSGELYLGVAENLRTPRKLRRVNGPL